MYLQCALVALLTLTGLSGPAPQADGSARALNSRAAAVESAAGGAIAAESADAVTLEEIDIIVPPVTPAMGATATEASPEPQSAPGEVVADQLVTPERVESEVVDSAGFQTLGVTWPEGSQVDDLGGQIRTRTAGRWSEWIDLEPGDDAPDAGTADAANAVRGGTDPVSIGEVDAVQLAFAATPDGGPDGLSLALVGSAETTTSPDRVVGSAASRDAAVRSASFATGTLKTAAAPQVISRAEWGAPAQVCTPDVAGKLVGAVVHHTAGSNSYGSVAQAMQQIRNDAAYHISGRGWCDIGYNFIVDKWGNIYEGRANSLTQAVVGVHAGGFNTGTVGVSMLGTYDAVPSAATQQAVGQIIGWRLGAYGVEPQGSMNFYTAGGENSRFANQTVNLPRVMGHRDVAFTACPGGGGYAALPNIRSAATLFARTASPVNALPVGHIDAVSTTTSSISIAGWALDPDTSDSIGVHVYVDGAVTPLLANGSRLDVGNVYGRGDLHGFTATILASQGDHPVCVYALDSTGGVNPLIECKSVRIGATPFGYIDTAVSSPGMIEVGGWALDPDTSAPIPVHVYVDGFSTPILADGVRPDVGSIFGNGDRHGFYAELAATNGTHNVCVYAINFPSGVNPVLGCRTLLVSNADPAGSLDLVTGDVESVTVRGWALDPDTTSPIAVHVYVDGVATVLLADRSRPDVGIAYRVGNRHGFDMTISTTPGAHRVCVYAISFPYGANPLVGCRTVTVVVNSSPFGSLDLVAGGPGSVTVRGWALDPDTSGSIAVHVYVDGIGTPIVASGSRPDVEVIYFNGDRHGFYARISASPGVHQVCVYSINSPAGVNPVIGCSSVRAS